MDGLKLDIINAFLSQNPTVNFLSGMVALGLIIAFLQRTFKLSERNKDIDHRTDAELDRLTKRLDTQESRIKELDASVRERDEKIANLTGRLKFVEAQLEASVRDYDRLRIENNDLKTENADLRIHVKTQSGELTRLQAEQVEDRRQITRLREQVRSMADARMTGNRRAGDMANETIPGFVSPAVEKSDPRDSD